MRLLFAVGVLEVPIALWAWTMSPTELTAFTVALVALITALGTAVVNIMNARAVRVAIATTTAKVEEVSAKADVVVGHVNSAATRSAEQISALQRELVMMREDKADKKETAALLAQAVATSPPRAARASDTEASEQAVKPADDRS